MRIYLIYYRDQFGYDDDTTIWAYNESEALQKFYQDFHSGCRVKRIC